MQGVFIVLAAFLAVGAVSAGPINYDISSSSGNSPMQSVSYSSGWSGPAPFICPCEGDFADPSSTGFFSCVSDGNGGFIAYRKPCPYGTFFNPKIDACDWIENSKKLYYPQYPVQNPIWPAPAPPSWPVAPGKWA